MSTGLLYGLYSESGRSAHLQPQPTSAEVSILQESPTSAEYELHKNLRVGWDYQLHKPLLSIMWSSTLWGVFFRLLVFVEGLLPGQIQRRLLQLRRVCLVGVVVVLVHWLPSF